MSPSAALLGTGAALLVVAAVPTAPPGRALALPVDVRGRMAHGGPARIAAHRRTLLQPLGALALRMVLAMALAPLAPPLAIALLVVPPVRQRLQRIRAARARADAVARALPDTVDLLLLCAGAGLSLPLALPLVAERTPDPVGAALRDAEAAVAGGRPRADATAEHLGSLGDPAAAVAHVLVDHLRYGVPLVPGLERAGFELRLARRRRAEEAARRLPVRLLAPLLLCVLPAFVLLTVVPLLVAALRSLPR